MEGTLSGIVEQAPWVLSYPEERVVELVGAVGEVRRGFFGDRV